MAAAKRSVSLRAVALPAEHGGWGFILTPILLGLLAAPTWAGALFSLSAAAAFLVHQPLKMAIKDRRKGRRYERTAWAERFAGGYGLVTGLAFAAVLLLADDVTFIVPILLAIGLMLVQLFFDARNQSRELLPELSGAVAPGSVAAAIALLDGWTLPDSLALWVVLVAWAVPSVLYVRARLRLEKGKEDAANPVVAWSAHIVGLLAVAALAAGELVPWLAVLAIAILLARAVKGLSSLRRPTRVVIIGVGEMVYGFLVAILVAVGYM